MVGIQGLAAGRLDTAVIQTETPAPLVSVVMSCFNASRWLAEAIDSVLAQTFQDFEFIVVDDGSMDATPGIIQGYADVDSRVVVISKPNTGLADSLNVGIARARGSWIARMDADDVSEPTRLQRQVAHAKANPALGFIGTGLTEIDSAGHRVATHVYPPAHSQLLRRLLSGRAFPPHSSAFYRTDLVSSVGGYRPRIRRAQDWDLWLRLSEKTQLACLETPLVRIRKHTSQISHYQAGRRQQIDSRIAMASYFLRAMGCPDPVDADEATFDAFDRWMAAQLQADGLFALYDSRHRLRAALQQRGTAFSRLVAVAAVVREHPALLPRLLRDGLPGAPLARRLAQQWVKTHPNDPSREEALLD